MWAVLRESRLYREFGGGEARLVARRVPGAPRWLDRGRMRRQLEKRVRAVVQVPPQDECGPECSDEPLPHHPVPATYAAVRGDCPATRTISQTGDAEDEVYYLCLLDAGHRGTHDWDEP